MLTNAVAKLIFESLWQRVHIAGYTDDLIAVLASVVLGGVIFLTMQLIKKKKSNSPIKLEESENLITQLPKSISFFDLTKIHAQRFLPLPHSTRVGGKKVNPEITVKERIVQPVEQKTVEDNNSKNILPPVPIDPRNVYRNGSSA